MHQQSVTSINSFVAKLLFLFVNIILVMKHSTAHEWHFKLIIVDDSIFAECNRNSYPAPTSNVGTPDFGVVFVPGTAVSFVCADGFQSNGALTFTCNSEGIFSPSTPPNCQEGNQHHKQDV